MTEEERNILVAAVELNNRMVGYFYDFIRMHQTGDRIDLTVGDVVDLFDVVEAHRRNVSEVEIAIFNRGYRPSDQIATMLGTTWRLLSSASLNGKVRMVPELLEVREPIQAAYPEPYRPKYSSA